MDNPLLSSSSSEIPLILTESKKNTEAPDVLQLERYPGLGSTKFNFLLLKRFLRILGVLFPKVLSVTLVFFISLVIVSAIAQYNYYYAGLIPSRFYGALTSHNEQDFKTSLYQSAIVLVSACVCKSAVTLVSGLIYVRWRALLTQHIHKLYFKGLNFYKVIVVYKIVDNPDQRITQDIERFCDQFANHVLPKLILWPFIVGYYTYKTFTTMGYIGVLVLYGYFMIATIINKFLMGPVISLVVEQESREGDFRFHHVYVRSNTESIAFYSGQSVERNHAKNYLGKLLKTQLNLYMWMFPLNLSVNLFDYFGSIITYIILGIIIFYGGSYDDQTPSQLAVTISQNSFFSLYLLNNFSTLIDQSSNLADMAGYAHRIGHFLEVCQRLEKNSDDKHKKQMLQKPPSHSMSMYSVNSDDSQDGHDMTDGPLTQECTLTEAGVTVAAVFNNLTVSSLHNGTLLLKDFSFQLEEHNNVLITGQSGTGKTSLFRVLKRLWPVITGRASVSAVDSQVMFLPQKPLLTVGSLADQITYPNKPEMDEQFEFALSVNENGIDEALRLAGLVHLRDRFGPGLDIPYDGDWNSAVSPGESQKIAFARLFYYKPSFAFLDEATSSMSEKDEEYFYSLLKQLGITFMSIGHRSTIKKFHDIEVHFTGGGNWVIHPLLG